MKRYSAQKVKKSYKKEKASELSIGKGFEQTFLQSTGKDAKFNITSHQ